MAATTKLCQHHCRHKCCPPRWSKFPSHEEDQTHLERTTSTDPIVHRHIFADHKWITKSFTVQCPAMRDLLQLALANYQDLDLDVKQWTFYPPFMPIVHRWENLLSLSEDKEIAISEEARNGLMKFLRPILAPQVDALTNTKFEDVWQIFAPHDFVITSFYGVEAACRVVKYELIKREMPPSQHWEITLEYLDWNGHCCGYISTKVNITQFSGYRRVLSLPVYPLSFRGSASAVRQQMRAQGRQFEALRGYHFQKCSGTKILLGKHEARPVAGRVVVDAFAYYLTNDIVKPALAPLDPNDRKAQDKREEKEEQAYGVGHGCFECPDGAWTMESDSEDEVPSDTQPVEGNAEMTAKSSNHSITRPDSLEGLTDDQFLVANPWVKGLDLKTKEWAQFCVDDLSPVEWNDDAFGNLVLPGAEKQLAWEFVENKALANDFDDFIQDKGRGLIILMFGPPGVGKTYTAEAVTEQARVPLYCMSAGELGTVPKDVEAALGRALTLCGLWDAMLLLDEADVFLSARTDSDLARNELVAVFLTKLEYYTGVCFLTTNRITSLDPAFQSRVDLFLPYKDLTVASRRKVWENFILRAGPGQADVSGEDLDKLAEIQLNGREIKNIIKSAHLLGLKSGGILQAERLFLLAENRMSAIGQLQ